MQFVIVTRFHFRYFLVQFLSMNFFLSEFWFILLLFCNAGNICVVFYNQSRLRSAHTEIWLRLLEIWLLFFAIFRVIFLFWIFFFEKEKKLFIIFSQTIIFSRILFIKNFQYFFAQNFCYFCCLGRQYNGRKTHNF